MANPSAITKAIRWSSTPSESMKGPGWTDSARRTPSSFMSSSAFTESKTAPWNAIQLFRQYEAAVRQVPIERLTQLASAEEGPLIERTCAENPNSFFPGEDVLAIPQAAKADF